MRPSTLSLCMGQLIQVDSFTYLRSTISKDGRIDSELVKTCQRLVVSLEDWVPGYWISIMSRQELRARSTGPLSYPLSYMVRKGRLSIKFKCTNFTHTWWDTSEQSWKSHGRTRWPIKRYYNGGPAHKNEPTVGRTCHENALWEITKESTIFPTSRGWKSGWSTTASIQGHSQTEP